MPPDAIKEDELSYPSDNIYHITMVRLRKLLSRSRYFRTLLYFLSCGCLLMLINIAFGWDLMNREIIYKAGDSFLPLPPFFRHYSAELEMDKKHRERMAVFQRIFDKQAKYKKIFRQDSSQICIHPHLDLKHDANKHAYYNLEPLNCSGNFLFYIDNRVVKLNKTALGKQDLGKCVYLGIERVTDDYFTYTEPMEKDQEPYDIILEQDFLRIQCFLKGKSQEEPKLETENHVDNDFPSLRRLLEKKTSEDMKRSFVVGNNFRLIPNVSFDIKPNLISQFYNSNNHSKYNNTGTINKKYDSTGPANNSKNPEENTEDFSKQKQNVNELENTDFEQNYYHSNEDRVHIGDYGDYGYDHWGPDGNQIYGAESTEADFDQFLLQVHPKPSVFERIANIEPNTYSTRMNVLIIGVDSMSQLSYRRKMPKTVKYLEELGSVILNGYNIVGDATTAALIPMLTGKSEVELPEVRKADIEAEMVDSYPLIWKKFEDDGYATMFVEDEPSIAVFNLRLTGFDKQPTDHYMRPFWLALWDSVLRSDSVQYCTGKTPHHTFFLNYIKDFFIKYNNVSKFVFAFQSELGHWDNNPVQYMDEDMVDLLHFLNKNGYLDNTLLVLMGDHGARYSKVRNTVQGKLEERLPMMSFRFPPWFKEKFPNAIKTLMKNADRLSTPFDIHETLLDILDYSRLKTHNNLGARSMSLLKEIPLDRTCASAGIDVHWCACLLQIHIETDDKFVQNSALHMVSFMNNITKAKRNLCSKLTLNKVLTATMVLPNEMVLKYRNSKDDDQRIANFTDDINMDKAHYQITIETIPNKGIYEATVEVDFRNETYRYSVTADISRIDRYGKQPKCVEDKFPDLRKYCFCDPLATNQTAHINQRKTQLLKKSLKKKPPLHHRQNTATPG